MADVFISYAREDRPRAELIARELGAMGLDCFWDTEIPPGQTWADFIEAKLGACKALIVLWSEHSTKSQWVREEARMGRDKGKLIPVMLDASPAPFGFGEVQAANLANWRGDANHPDWMRFANAVDLAVRGPGAAPRAAAQAASASAVGGDASPLGDIVKRLRGVPNWAWAVGGLAATTIVVGIIAMNLLDDPKPVAEAAVAQPQPQPAAMQPVAPPAADASPQAIILAQLQQAQAALASQGFQQIGQPYSGSLAQGQTWNVPVEMHAGYDYRVLGVCDRDCADLDLVLFDPNGAMVMQDTSTTSQPIVGLQPVYSANFTIQVQMYNCTIAPCYYALALYGRAPQ